MNLSEEKFLIKKHGKGICRKNILLIYGCILLIAIFFIPYNSTHVIHKTDPYTLNKYRVTTKDSGYIFLFQYLKKRTDRFNPKEIDRDSYYFNKNLYIIELAIIIFSAGFSYIIFCTMLKRSRDIHFEDRR